MSTIECWHGQLSDEADHQHWQRLSAEEQAHAATLKNPVLRTRYVSVRSHLRQVLAQKLAIQAKAIVFSKAEHGKPYLADYPELAFNLSHSANAWVIAVGWGCRLGVDIEIAKPRANLAALVEKCFADVEASYWHSLPEHQQTAAFYRFWTRKEAFVKATGRGIALGLKQCVVNPEQPTEFLTVPAEFAPASVWRVLDLDVGQGLVGAVAVDQAVVVRQTHQERLNLQNLIRAVD
ncbi:MAG: 4'-phosphopantetheinyl transferase superfamily protein [Methylococcaceae bacterium]|nr:4'-phosphopantetheinyl transferase superfamily protein [Methylococcaceae bacterium]MDP2394932.1 4'-phosphopantetheinyl transferase superfamily protein [Methylococcaceae bacterium]MDP3019458.1 4'-phosphopantetheinyl transferase superfamily protein [Methylococcaceae bacterium]MDP3391749.1 4'-phosphopantetheinyl transferase superfamily protein [Methylococcaceae bacterium]MDP3932035.1 4'-phosphopantetheinyl transferase superfamily protein [Methylococcaceae bacterium]